MTSLHDQLDSALSTHGANSIYQRIRLLKPKERELFDELFKQAEAGEGFDLPKAARSAGVSVKRLEEKIPDLMRRLGMTEEVWFKQHLTPLLGATKRHYNRETEEEIEIPDNSIRLDLVKYLGDCFGARNEFNINVSGTITHELTVAEKEEALESLKRIQEFAEAEKRIIDIPGPDAAAQQTEAGT